jgi:zeaxanthin glucosyltransferase
MCLFHKEYAGMKIGFLSLPMVGHLNPMTALARKLQSRGHEILFFGIPDVEPFAQAANLPFVPFCEKDYPTGSITNIFGTVATLQNNDDWKRNMITPSLLTVMPDSLRKKLEENRVDAMIIDKAHLFMELVPMSLGIPYVHVWTILHMDFSGATPVCIFPWSHETTEHAHSRNIAGVKQLKGFFVPAADRAKTYAEKHGLRIDWDDLTATHSTLAEITQTPREFDFPNIPWPANFHYTGPFHDDEGREDIPFPWERLNSKPLIYASLGTLVNGIEKTYNAILTAAASLTSTQLVLSIGNNVNAEALTPIPADAIIVRKAPQIALLKRAALCITHAGINTVLESLAQGVPMVALPITYDQPGIAARIAFHGVGEFIAFEDLTGNRLLESIQKVLGDSKYGNKAHYFQQIIADTQGLDAAASIVERALLNQWPRSLTQ